jgi:predicted nucleic acid-binding protein
MADRIVMNTGPLIALAQASALDVAGALPIQFCCPDEVKSEFDEGVQLGLSNATWPAWLQVIPLAQPLNPLARLSLDPGEAAVIQLALEQNIACVCIDEVKGRRYARGLGLSLTGSLGLLGRAKRLGLIPLVKPYIDTIMSTGTWYHPELVRRFLADMAE